MATQKKMPVSKIVPQNLPKVRQEAGPEIRKRVTSALNAALEKAEQLFNGGVLPDYQFSVRFKTALDAMAVNSSKATTAYNNLVTCLAIKVAKPTADIRYHQAQIQKDTMRPASFNFRGVSEKVIYPWLNRHTFDGAKSGWQTRTLERPKPYFLTYDENIGDIKVPFLTCFDEVEENGQSAELALAYLIYDQLVRREGKKITLSIPQTKDIALILEVLKKHFFHPYQASKGASRLPVLALYSIYSVMIKELSRFTGKSLRPLMEHSAADSQTGAVGDIEVADSESGHIYEALEIKHNLPLTEAVLLDVGQKIATKSIDRYYILTTHSKCEPDESLSMKIEKFKALHGCQIIANGVFPAVRYYLRMLSNPSQVFPAYVALLESDKSVAHEHREVWNKIAVAL